MQAKRRARRQQDGDGLQTCCVRTILIWSYVVSNYLKGQSPLPPSDLLHWNSGLRRGCPAAKPFLLSCATAIWENRLVRGQHGTRQYAARSVEGEGAGLQSGDAARNHIAPGGFGIVYGSQFFGGSGCGYVLSGDRAISARPWVNRPRSANTSFWTNDNIKDNLPGGLDQGRRRSTRDRGWPGTGAQWLAKISTPRKWPAARPSAAPNCPPIEGMLPASYVPGFAR